MYLAKSHTIDVVATKREKQRVSTRGARVLMQCSVRRVCALTWRRATRSTLSQRRVGGSKPGQAKRRKEEKNEKDGKDINEWKQENENRERKKRMRKGMRKRNEEGCRRNGSIGKERERKGKGNERGGLLQAVYCEKPKRLLSAWCLLARALAGHSAHETCMESVVRCNMIHFFASKG